MESTSTLQPNSGATTVSAQKPTHRANSARARARFEALFGYLCRHRKYVIAATIILVPGGFVCPAAIWLHRRLRRPTGAALADGVSTNH